MPFMGMATDQAPEAHRWKLEPSMQFHSPSLEQGPVCRPVEDPPLAGAGAGGEETPVPVGPEQRKAYLDALEHASLSDDLAPFQMLMLERLDETLAGYLEALS